MKMRIVKDSPTGRKLAALLERAAECNKALKELGDAEKWPNDFMRSSTNIAGGLIGLAFSEKPEGWRRAGYINGKMFYYPAQNRKASRDALKKIEALPRLTVFQWNDAIGWDGFLSRYGLIERKDFFLLAFPEKLLAEAPAPTGEDFVEITNLEYETRKAGE